MLWIETGIALPKATLVNEAKNANASVLHLPALSVIDLHAEFSLKGFDAVFVASPRAAGIVCAQLKTCESDIYAIGESTAKAIEKEGIAVKQFGDGSGAETFIFSLKQNGVNLQNIAWLSAEETAADLPEIAQKFKIKIQHIAVYKTVPAIFSKEQIAKIEHPCKWILRSGKGVYAVQDLFKENDIFEPIGKSASDALKNFFATCLNT